ncbi:5'-methylthioadenosine/adenosylhomocysteine nucleosidase [Paenibacillus sp. JX-17]|uniref:adenosylhomocysteine nucleosidase n=1 Tax=Paenibacillus lacisoli TaxID=3064525 RepID=A0ABT9C7P7_9BACL|nr:5'-methylthioadenosine/adenosylhomocysteine nucleosidase [Paenibacillus sp. JX-17]MDO7905282.1 5'-methylthioadenosine/adenosylhomocysteine nucleosidase [Paenibacillus sp. JX-17]
MDKLTGIIGAMDEEVELLLAAMGGEAETEQVAGVAFTTGMIYGRSVVVCKSGVGKVNAAVTTQILVDRYDVERVIFTGVAGAVDPDLNVGDIVISTSCVHHDMDVTALGYEHGVIPYQEVSSFAADPALVELAEQACRELHYHYLTGIVLSGDQFIADREHVLWLHKQLNGSCTEMEGAAVAQACHMNGVPFLILRSMSDKADGSAHISFEQFTVEAARRSHHIVANMLEHL